MKGSMYLGYKHCGLTGLCTRSKQPLSTAVILLLLLTFLAFITARDLPAPLYSGPLYTESTGSSSQRSWQFVLQKFRKCIEFSPTTQQQTKQEAHTFPSQHASVQATYTVCNPTWCLSISALQKNIPLCHFIPTTLI